MYQDLGSDPAIMALTKPDGFLANNDPPKQGAKGSHRICKCQRVDVEMGDLADFQSDCKCMGSFDCRGKGEAVSDDEIDEDEEDDEDEDDHDAEEEESDEDEEKDGSEDDPDAGEDESDEEEEESDDSSEDEEPVHIRDPKEKRRQPTKSRLERETNKLEREQKTKEDKLQRTAKYFTDEALIHGGDCCNKRCHLVFSHHQILAFRTKYHRLLGQEQGRLLLQSRMHIKPQSEDNQLGMCLVFVPIMKCPH
jgi:cobalamin biosynthesis protein CobT